ncbi:MAG: carbohydrate binding domain-containing protein, partial [Bacteroidota bacterium]
MKKMPLVVLTVACLALATLLVNTTWAAEPEVAGQNLVANGGFEKGLEGWGGPGKASTEQKAEGEQSARLDATDAEKVPYVAQANVPLQPGKYYRVSMSLYRTNGQGYVYVHCNWRNKAGAPLMISKTWAMPRAVPMTSRTGEHTGRWCKLSGIIRNQHPDLGGMQLVILQRDGADIVYVDDVRVEEVRYPAAPEWKFPQAVTFPGSPSKMGMKVESARQEGQWFAISTTGVYWDFDPGKGWLTAVQRIGKPRVIFTAHFTGLRGPWRISTRNDDVVVVQGPDTALGFQGDSLLTLATNTPVTVWVQGQIVPRHFQRLDPYLMAIDEQGGFCAMPYSRPNLSSDGTVLKMREQEMKLPGWGAEYQVGAKEMLGLAVFPGRPFNWEQSFTKRIVNTA